MLDEEVQLAILEVKEQLLEELAHLRQELLEQIKPKRAAKFQPPDTGTIFEYCREKNIVIDVLAFWDFYKSKDWMIGKSKMKDWKAAVRNWARRQQPTAQPTHRPESEAAKAETRRLLDDLPERDTSGPSLAEQYKAQVREVYGD